MLPCNCNVNRIQHMTVKLCQSNSEQKGLFYNVQVFSDAYMKRKT